jgi:hypothetical protein
VSQLAADTGDVGTADKAESERTHTGVKRELLVGHDPVVVVRVMDGEGEVRGEVEEATGVGGATVGRFARHDGRATELRVLEGLALLRWALTSAASCACSSCMWMSLA